MNPVLQRELRARSRSVGLWSMRCGAALWALLAFWGMARFIGERQAMHGRDLYLVVNWAAVVVLGMTGTWLTHDVVSRERRDGTLGLLMLSPLSASQVMAGKASSAVVEGVSAWWSMVPVLVLPLLMGGVRVEDVVTMTVLQGAMLAVSMASGLAASAWNTAAAWALFVGYGMTLCLAGVVVLPAGVVLASTGVGMWTVAGVVLVLVVAVVLGLLKLAGAELRQAWDAERAGTTPMEGPSFVLAVGEAPGSAKPMTAGSLPDQDPGPEPSGSPYAAISVATEPGWLERRAIRRRRGLLETDPLGWLLLRRHGVLWMVPVGMAGVYVWWLTAAGGHEAPRWPEWVIPMVMSVSMAGWLREERANGTLEIIMTTPCAGRLEGSLCRRLWVENGTWVALHGALTLVMAFFADGGTRWGFLPLVAAVWGSPWILLLVSSAVQGWWSRALLGWVLIRKVPDVVGHVMPAMVTAWVQGEPVRFREGAMEHGLQAVALVGVTACARAWLHRRR